MPTWNFPKVAAGQPIGSILRADYHNAIRDALRWVNSRMSSGSGSGGPLQDDVGVVLVRNDSGVDLAPGSVLGVGATIPIGPADNLAEFQCRRLLSGVAPAVAAHAGKFLIALDGLPAGAIGRALASGVAAVQIYLAAGGSAPAFADVADGQTGFLQPGTGGAQVLWCAPAGASAGPVWALVRLPSGGGLIRFELYDDCQPGDVNKAAYPMLDDLSDANTSASTVQVSDLLLKDIRAFGRNHSGAAGGWKGARGWYLPGTFGTSPNIYHNPIVAIQRLARTIRVTSPATDTAYGATFTGSSLVVLDDGQDPSAGTGSLTGIVNRSWCTLPRNTSNVVCELDAQGSTITYRVVEAQPLAKLISVATPSTCTSTTFTVTSCTVDDEGANPCAGGASITISTGGLVVGGTGTLQCRYSGTEGQYVVVSAPRSAQLAAAISGTVPSTQSAGASFSAYSLTAVGDGFAPSSATVINWGQQTCSGGTFTAIIVNGSSCTPTYLVIDAPCPPSGGCTS